MSAARLLGIRRAGSFADPAFDPFGDPWSPWIANFAVEGGIIFPGGRDECVFSINGYDPESKAAHIVRLKLARAGSEMPIWSAMMNGLELDGMPELHWANNEERG